MNPRIRRSALEARLRAALARSRAVALIGPRQVSKTTPARGFLPAESPRHCDPESARDLQRLESGASWDGFVLEQVLHHARSAEAYFWATHKGAELDLLLFKHGRRVGVEIKRADAPSFSPSKRIALQDRRLDRLLVIYPGDKPYRLWPKVEVVPTASVAEFVE